MKNVHVSIVTAVLSHKYIVPLNMNEGPVTLPYTRICCYRADSGHVHTHCGMFTRRGITQLSRPLYRPTDVLAPNRVRPTAWTVRITGIFLPKFRRLLMILNLFLPITWHHSNWPADPHEISMHFRHFNTHFTNSLQWCYRGALTYKITTTVCLTAC